MNLSQPDDFQSIAGHLGFSTVFQEMEAEMTLLQVPVSDGRGIFILYK